MRALGSSEPIGDGRGAPVVVVPAGGTSEALVRTLDELARNTEEAVPLIVACGEGHARELESLELSREVLLLGLGARSGVAAALRAVHARAPDADLALVCEGVLVTPGWLEGLRDAAHADSIVMTASPLAESLGDASAIEASTASLREVSSGARPTLARARRDCCLVRGAALQLVGIPDTAAAEEDAVGDLSARLSALALIHVLAEEVLVGGEPEADLIVADSLALRRVIAVARTTLRPLSVTVDARALGVATTGTRTYILDLIAALASEQWLRLRVVLPPDVSPTVLALLEERETIELISYDEALSGVPLTDVVHRPQQIFTTDDVNLLRLLGERVVVSHHDLIAYRCAAYHETTEAWRDYRRATRLALAQADMAVFPSRHARHDALRESLIAPERAHTIPIGADRIWPQPAESERRPDGIPDDGGLLVCIGADYAHKNRPFALALVRALHERHGWSGRLVLAGPHVAHGSSRDCELAMLEQDPALASLVLDIGLVDDAGRAWLYAHADAVVYPSVYEGFGLIPFEAAEAGVPCLYAPAGALAELAGAEVATLVPWDPDASADAVAPLLAMGPAREAHLGALVAAARAVRWETCVPLLRRVYAEAVASPYRSSAPRVREELEREAHIVALAASAEHDRARAAELRQANADAQRANQLAQQANHEAQQALAQTHEELNAMRASVGGFAETSAGGFLSHAQRLGLLRVASRPLLRRVLFAPFALGGRGRGGGRGSGPPPDGA